MKMFLLNIYAVAYTAFAVAYYGYTTFVLHAPDYSWDLWLNVPVLIFVVLCLNKKSK